MKINGLFGKLALILVFCLAVSAILSAADTMPGSVHNTDTGLNYITIQAAVDAASSGNHIVVDSGRYNEIVTIPANKESLTIKGNDTGAGNPIIDAGGVGNAVTVYANNITISGFGVTGATRSYSSAGIAIYSSNNKVSNISAFGNSIGVYLLRSNYNSLSGINASNNTNFGVHLYSSNDSSLNGITALNNSYGIFLHSSQRNSLAGINANLNANFGVVLTTGSDYNKVNGINTTFNKNSGISVSGSHFNTINGINTFYNSYFGLFMDHSSDNSMAGVNASNNYNVGISITTGSYRNSLSQCISNFNSFAGLAIAVNGNNDVSDCDFSSNRNYGVSLYLANNNSLKRIKATNNPDGIILESSSYNSITESNISNNSVGIRVYSPSNNDSISNNVLNNTKNVYLVGLNANSWNITKEPGINIIGGPNLGGNFWGNPSGTGFSQTCTDTDRDGICDSVYALDANNIDFLPLAVNDTTAPASVTNLTNVSYASNHINWTWTDPADLDFAKVLVYLNGIYVSDVLKGIEYYDAIVEPGTYTIGIRTVDTNGNANLTMKTHTATTILPAIRYINGTVIDGNSGLAMPGVKVTINTGPSIMTGPTGSYSFAVSEGTYTLVSSNNDIRYYVNTTSVSTIGRAVANQDIEMVLKPTGSISGSVIVK